MDKTNGNRQFAAEVNGRFTNDLGPGAGNFQIENNGPVSVTLLAMVDAPVAHTTRVTLFRDTERIEIQNDLTGNFNKTQSWSFSFAIQNPNVHHEEVGAILRARLTNDGGHYSPHNARYDWLTLNHFVAINQNDEFGVTLSTADCYYMRLGNSTVSELDINTPQISILAGRSGLNQGSDEHFLQRFALKPHSAYDPVLSMKFALEHQNPLVAGRVDGGDFYPESSYSLLSLDNRNVLLWALKPADDGLEAGLVVRVWNLLNEREKFSLSFNDDEIASVLSLTHVETPVGIGIVEDGRLVDTINQQQIKTYAIFPTTLSYAPDTFGLDSVTTTPISTQPTAKVEAGNVTPDSASSTDTILPPITPTAQSEQDGRGCLYGLLYVLGLLKK